MRKMLVVGILLGSVAWGQYRIERNIKSSYLGINAVAVSCRDGADPTGKTMSGVLIISCGK